MLSLKSDPKRPDPAHYRQNLSVKAQNQPAFYGERTSMRDAGRSLLVGLPLLIKLKVFTVLVNQRLIEA
jgi:hypothetical protein